MPSHTLFKGGASTPCLIFVFALAMPLPAAAQSCPPLSSLSSGVEGLTLGLAESRLASCNRDVLAARRPLEAAEADRITAGQRPNPNLTLRSSDRNHHAGDGGGALRDQNSDNFGRTDQLH